MKIGYPDNSNRENSGDGMKKRHTGMKKSQKPTKKWMITTHLTTSKLTV